MSDPLEVEVDCNILRDLLLSKCGHKRYADVERALRDANVPFTHSVLYNALGGGGKYDEYKMKRVNAKPIINYIKNKSKIAEGEIWRAIERPNLRSNKTRDQKVKTESIKEECDHFRRRAKFINDQFGSLWADYPAKPYLEAFNKLHEMHIKALETGARIQAHDITKEIWDVLNNMSKDQNVMMSYCLKLQKVMYRKIDRMFDEGVLPSIYFEEQKGRDP